MPAYDPPRYRRAMGAFLVLILAAACVGDGAEPPVPGPGASASPSPGAASPTPAAPEFQVAVALGGVRATGIGSDPGAPALAAPAEAVRRTIAEYYALAFVDPASWDEGAFTPLFRLFASEVRDRAHEDVAELTLGPAAAQIDSVRPTRARTELRFLTDAGDRPVAVVAEVLFIGVARAGDERAPVHHEGEFVLRQLDDGWRIVAWDVRGRAPALGDLEGGPTEASFAPGIPSAEPLTMLVIGSDARPGQPVTQMRADSLHLVGVNPNEGVVSILGIPRDAWVPIPGFGTDKINASLVRGGPELVVRTVEDLTGAQIDAYAITGFAGFMNVVKAVGGIDVDVPYAIFDRYAHARFREGPDHLNPKEALAFSRARHDLPRGDFDRSLNQGRLLIGALATLRDRVADGQGGLLPWVVAGAQEVRTDLSLSDLFDLFLAAPTFDPASVRNRVASGRVGSVGGRSVVFLDAAARAMFRDLARDAVLGA